MEILEGIAKIKSNIDEISNILNQILSDNQEINNNKLIENSRIKIFEKQYKITFDNAELKLNGRVYETFKYMYEKRPNVVSREELLKNVWEYSFYNVNDIRTVDVLITRMRKIIRKTTDFEIIKTKKQVGYYIEID